MTYEPQTKGCPCPSRAGGPRSLVQHRYSYARRVPLPLEGWGTTIFRAMLLLRGTGAPSFAPAKVGESRIIEPTKLNRSLSASPRPMAEGLSVVGRSHPARSRCAAPGAPAPLGLGDYRTPSGKTPFSSPSNISWNPFAPNSASSETALI